MNRLLQDGLTAPLRYKLVGLLLALVLGFAATTGAVLMRLIGDVGFAAAAIFGLVMGVIGLMFAGLLARRKKAG